jgi:hypothetical protein
MQCCYWLFFPPRIGPDSANQTILVLIITFFLDTPADGGLEFTGCLVMGIEALQYSVMWDSFPLWHFCKRRPWNGIPFAEGWGLSVGSCRMCAQLGSSPIFFVSLFCPLSANLPSPFQGIRLKRCACPPSLAAIHSSLRYCLLRIACSTQIDSFLLSQEV